MKTKKREAAELMMPREATDEMIDAALAATATWLDIKGSALTVNREKMRLRYRAMVRVADYHAMARIADSCVE